MKEGIILSVTKWSRIISMAIVLGVFLAGCGDDDNSFAPHDDDSSSSVCEDCDEITSSSSSSSVILSSSEGSSSSSSKEQGDGGSEAAMTSSSAKSSSSVTPKSSSSETSVSSSSEYVPFDHSKAFDGTLWRADAYKTFIDTRNGREYYYLEMEANGKSLKVMAENLNVGDMVKGYKNQQDDSKIERYCYDNDTTNCDRYGGLYQWAEMMPLPSECNTKSCADLIQENHQGICPDGWRLMTAADFEFIVKSNGNTHGVEGTRSTFGFGGYNTTGFSLVGAGARNVEGNFEQLNKAAYWFYLTEYSDVQVMSSWTSTNNNKIPESHLDKKHGVSVRCVMVE